MFHNIEKDNLLCHNELDHIWYYDAYDICMAISIFNESKKNKFNKTCLWHGITVQTYVVNIMNENRKACCPFMIICFENDVV